MEGRPPANRLFCPSCGTDLPAGARFCAKCGNAIQVGTGATDAAATKRGTLRWLLPILIAVVALAGVAGSFLLRGSSSDEIVLGVANRDGTYDLHVVDLGEDPNRGNRAVRDIHLSVAIVVEGEPSHLRNPAVRALAVAEGWLMVYRDADRTKYVVAAIKPGGVNELFDTRASGMSAPAWNPAATQLTIRERLESSDRCYSTDGSQAAKRISSAESCFWVAPGIAVEVETDEDTVEIEVETDEGETRRIAVRDFQGEYAITRDGLFAAVAVVDSQNEYRVELYDLRTGSLVLESDRYASIWNVWALGRTGPLAAASVEDRNGNRSLLIVDPAAPDVVEIRDGIDATLAVDGTHAFVTTSNEKTTLSVIDLATYELSRLVESDEPLRSKVVADDSVVVVSGDETISIATAEGTVTDLGDATFGDELRSIYARPLPGGNILLLTSGADDEGSVSSLYQIDLPNGTMTDVISGWYETSALIVDPDGDYVVVVGNEDNDEDRALWAVWLDGSASVTELDDDGSNYYDVVLRGNSVYYSARVGDDSEDVEVRRVDVRSGERPEVIYENARLVQASWADPGTWFR